MKKILLATPRGFCAGVDRAIHIVEKALESILENMDIDERRKFDIQYQVLEDKTIKSLKK